MAMVTMPVSVGGRYFCFWIRRFCWVGIWLGFWQANIAAASQMLFVPIVVSAIVEGLGTGIFFSCSLLKVFSCQLYFWHNSIRQV